MLRLKRLLALCMERLPCQVETGLELRESVQDYRRIV
jgi:hypothetical protein